MTGRSERSDRGGVRGDLVFRGDFFEFGAIGGEQAGAGHETEVRLSILTSHQLVVHLVQILPPTQVYLIISVTYLARLLKLRFVVITKEDSHLM